jgi:hypothetical protein
MRALVRVIGKHFGKMSWRGRAAFGTLGSAEPNEAIDQKQNTKEDKCGENIEQKHSDGP